MVHGTDREEIQTEDQANEREVQVMEGLRRLRMEDNLIRETRSSPDPVKPHLRLLQVVATSGRETAETGPGMVSVQPQDGEAALNPNLEPGTLPQTGDGVRESAVSHL